MTNTTENIILIGMPGAGKSTLGVVLAKILGYEFIDADLLIQGKLDKTLQKIIDACGPDGFIEVENEVLCTLSTSPCHHCYGWFCCLFRRGHEASVFYWHGCVPAGFLRRAGKPSRRPPRARCCYEERHRHELGRPVRGACAPVRKVRRSYYRYQRPFGSRCGTKARRSNHSML